MKVTIAVDRTVVFSLKQGFSSNFQNKGKSGYTVMPFFALEVPLCNLRPS